MIYSIEIIKSKAENILKENVVSVLPFENITNNYVYKLTTAKKQYIFKIYKQGWPEEGKLQYVNKVLSENNIPCARIVYYCHIDNELSHGFLIEEFLTGIIADKAILSMEQENDLFKKLASFVGRIHSIKFSKYGYIGSGNPFENTYSEYVFDAFDDNTESLRKKGLFNEEELLKVKNKLYRSLKLCDELSPVLCHGDLSKKNIMIQEKGKIVLIDYDDVTAIPWVCDVAHLTLWMKLNYSFERASYLRNMFLNNYPIKDKDIFYTTENALHVWECLGYMNFFSDTQMYNKVKKLFLEVWENMIK